MNLSNLAKLHGGYIHNPMIAEEVVNLTQEANVFNRGAQKFLELKTRELEEGDLYALFEKLKKDKSIYVDILSRIEEQLRGGKYRDYFLDLCRKKEFAKLAMEIDCINIGIIRPEIIAILEEYQKIGEPTDDQELDIYIREFRKNEAMYQELLANARSFIETKIRTTEGQLGALRKIAEKEANPAVEASQAKGKKKTMTIEEKIQAAEAEKVGYEEILRDERLLIKSFHQEKITAISALFKLIKGNISEFFENLVEQREKDKIVKLIHSYIDMNHFYNQFNIFIRDSIINNNRFYDFNKYISVFHKLIPFYKTFDRLSFIYDEMGNVTGRINFKLFRVIDGKFYLLTSYDQIARGGYKFFVINNSFNVQEVPSEPPFYFNKKLAIIPDIFRYQELVELFFNYKNLGVILNTFNDINILYNEPKREDPEYLAPFRTNVREIIDSSSDKDLIKDFDNILRYLFVNINGTLLPSKSNNIFNIFFYTGELEFAHNIILNDNIYDMIGKEELPSEVLSEVLQCIANQITKPEVGKEVPMNELMSRINKGVKEMRGNVNLDLVIDMIQGIKTNDVTRKYKLAIIYLVKKLYSDMAIRNCRDIYNFLFINDIITKIETKYYNSFDISDINSRLNVLNEWVSIPSNEDKVLFYFIFDIIECKLLFDKVSQKNYDIIIYAINTYMASMIDNSNIPFNINIFSNKIRSYYKLPKGRVPSSIDTINQNNMKLFDKKFKSVGYKPDHVCDPTQPTVCRPDCGEAAILNMIIYLLYDEVEMIINPDWLPTNSIDSIKQLFNKYRTIDNLDMKAVRKDEFNPILQGMEFVYQGLDSLIIDRYRYYAYQFPTSTNERFNNTVNTKEEALAMKIYNDSGEAINEEIKYTGWELRPGYITIVRILNKILGYSIGKSPDESLDEQFIMKNISKDSLKNILSTFNTPNIKKILENYYLQGEIYDEVVAINFGKLEGIKFNYNHAEFPDIADNNNSKIIGAYQDRSKRKNEERKYNYNRTRFYLLSNVREANFNTRLYYTQSDFITIMLTPKDRITNKFKTQISQCFNGGSNYFNFLSYIREPKFNYICELIKIYEIRFIIKELNSALTDGAIQWFQNRFRNFCTIPISKSSRYLRSLEIANWIDTRRYNTMKSFLENCERNVYTVLYDNNETLGTILLKLGYAKTYDDLKERIPFLKDNIGSTPLHIAYSMFTNLGESDSNAIINRIITYIESRYGIPNYNKKNKLNKYPIEPLLFSGTRRDSEFVMSSLKKLKINTLIEIICKNHFKFNAGECPNLIEVVRILPELLKDNQKLMRYIYDLLITSAIYKPDERLFNSIDYINSVLERFLNGMLDEDSTMKIQRVTENTDQARTLHKLIYKHQINIINTEIFINQNDEMKDRLVFPYIYNNNILETDAVRRYIIHQPTVARFSGIRDFNGDTIYHYIAKYFTYNYGIDTINNIQQRLYEFFEENIPINNLINNAGWSVIDILSIVPINFNIFAIHTERVKQFLEAHFSFLNEYYNTNGFRPTDKIILYRHIISKFFYAFENANILLTSINEFIADKPDIDNYFICSLNRGFYLYKYCDRTISKDLNFYLNQNNPRMIQQDQYRDFGNRNPRKVLFNHIIQNIYRDMITYDASTKPHHPFPREIWYKLLPANSPLSELIIPIKNQLKDYNRKIRLEEDRNADVNSDLDDPEADGFFARDYDSD